MVCFSKLTVPHFNAPYRVLCLQTTATRLLQASGWPPEEETLEKVVIYSRGKFRTWRADVKRKVSCCYQEGAIIGDGNGMGKIIGRGDNTGGAIIA